MAALPPRAHRRSVSRRVERGTERGQVVAIFALCLSVLFGFAGLALDTAHGHGVQMQEQYVADATSLSVAQLWKAEAGTTATGPPANAATDAAMLAAQTFAKHNLLVTNATPCVISSVSSGSGTDDDIFYGDGTATPAAPGAGCATTPPAYKVKVEVSIPPILPAAQWPVACNSPSWNCAQVTTTQVVPNFLFGLLGFPSSTVVATSISSANIPPVLLNPNLPPLFAESSYEKQSNFKKSAGYPTRGTYGGSCSNCLSHWNNGVEAQIMGYDWSIGCTGTVAACDHGVATAAAPVVIGTGGRTEYCDTYQGNTCASSSALGNYGFATAVSGGGISPVYCGTVAGGGPACDTTMVGAAGTEHAPPSPAYPTAGSSLDPSVWVPPAVSFSSAPDCGILILNGDTVNSSYTHQGFATPPAACQATAAEPYVIQPGKYSAIVINHGRYQFGSGVFDLYGVGTAPVNTHTSGWANGIDHSLETATDFDLCTGGTVTSCPTMKAAVWIGHGTCAQSCVGNGGTATLPPLNGQTGTGLQVGAYFAGSYPACTSGSSYQSAGGGDPTQVMGRGVYFRFEVGDDSTAGIVTTHEVSQISLAAPPLGTSSATSGVPILFDMESDASAAHLDGPGYTLPGTTGNASGFFGIIWTVHKGNTGAGSSHPMGGVELNPGLAETKNLFPAGTTAPGYHPALYGQIIADTTLYFGSSGLAVDLTRGWGTILPVASPNTSTRTDPYLLEQLAVSDAPGVSGYEQVTVLYTGSTAMDGFSSYLTVKGQPIYPSRPVWNTVAAQPPPNNNPGDAYPAEPLAVGWDSYPVDKDGFTAYVKGPTNGTNYSIGGDFVWGHQGAITVSTLPFGEHSFITYQFPTLADPTITVSWELRDGTTSGNSVCGNSTGQTLTFSNVGSTTKGSNLGAPPQVVG